MKTIYSCDRCGVVTEDKTEICQPHKVESTSEYCGSAPDRNALCTDMKDHLSYVCGSCGRPAEQAELVCDPLVIG